jgi:IclR family transcriptional regulator, acetate operon repressor
LIRIADLPTERFREKEQRIVAALRTAADSPAWTR